MLTLTCGVVTNMIQNFGSLYIYILDTNTDHTDHGTPRERLTN